MNFLKWFYPGMHVKRWLALLMVGIVIISLGFAYVLRETYETFSFPNWVWYVTLQFIPRYVRGALFMAAGIVPIVFAFWQLNRSILGALMSHRGREDRLVDII